jgi:signal transduction histidine kinase
MGRLKLFTLPLLILLLTSIFLRALGANYELNPDSIKQLLETSSEEQRLDLLLGSTEKIINKHPYEAIEYAKEALILATEQSNFLSIAKSQFLLAKGLNIIGNYHLAIDNLENAQSFYLESKDSLGLIETFQLFGQIFTRIGDFKKALDNTQEAFNIATKLNAKNKIAELVREIGNIYFYFDEKAIALDFFQKSLNLSIENKDKDGIAKAYNNMGRIYSELDNYKLALECLKKSLDSKNREEDRISYGNTLLNIGTVYLKKGEYLKALDFFNQANGDFSSVNNVEGIANSLYYKGLAYFHQKRYNQALAIYEEAWKVASTSDSKRLLVGISLALSDTYAEIGDFRRAYNNFRTYYALRDSVFSDEKAKLLIELETRYQLHAKQRQIELLSKDKAIKDIEKTQANVWIALLSIVALFLISITFFTYSRFKFKSKANEQLIQEIKHRKSVEAQLNQYQDHLENLVEERTWELKVAKEKAEESDKLKTAFLANMSHEIRTPMNAIVGFSYLLTDPESTEESKAEFIKVIKSNGEVLMNLINDILDISMIESSQLKTNTKPIIIKELLDELNYFFNQEKEKYKKSHISIITDYDKDCENLIINTDNIRLRQIISNLLSNALKFTEHGQISFGFRLTGSDEMIFFVRDTGIGIESDKHEIIFDRFCKFGSINDSQLFSGTGLGLAISKELVTMLGGKIWLDSYPEKGSTFYFTLPFKANSFSNAPIKRKETKVDKQKLIGRTILIAEDVASNYQLVSAFLGQSEVNILWAQNGAEAVDIFTKNKNIDIILMDIQMPIMDGLKALKKIREIDADIPVIVNSAFYLTDEMERSFAAGCSDYMTKPIRKEDLLNRLSNYFG